MKLLRQRSREAAMLDLSVEQPPTSPSRCAAELTACAAARSAKDYEGCLRSARAALQREPNCDSKAWAFLCWALFELRRYDEACAECLRALSHRAWPRRDREGMAALLTSCRLLSELSSTVGDQLRDAWYRKRLRALYEAGELHEYETGPEDRWGSRPVYDVGRDELSLLDSVCANGMTEVSLGGDGGVRNIPEGLLVGGDPSRLGDPGAPCPRGPNFPAEQALGGVVYLKGTILPFHCDKRFGPERTEEGDRGFACYNGNGPCPRCLRTFGIPVPSHRFPAWAPELAAGATVHQPHAQLDVFYSTNSVPLRLHQQLRSQLDALASKGPEGCPSTQAMPKYHTLIDPNLNAANGLWVPSEFEAVASQVVPCDLAIAVELACVSATGHRLPFGFGHAIASLAVQAEGAVRAECAMRAPIPGLDPHAHHKLHAATQRLMGSALPLLAKLRRPALLLPGPLQAVVKAQRIVLEEGEDYAGVWHEDGMDEHVVAVVLYYYRASPTLKGGALEFCSKQTQALWGGDGAGAFATSENAEELAASLPRCQVPIKEGTLVCFSNYAAVHRVLKMEAAHGSGGGSSGGGSGGGGGGSGGGSSGSSGGGSSGGGGSREFMAFFIIDQRHPLPTPRELPPLRERREASKALLVQQLQPRGTFGFDSSHVYSTGNGCVADVGWVRDGAGGSRLEEWHPDAATLIQRLNFQPPSIERGASLILQVGPRPVEDVAVTYNPESPWAEAWICRASGTDRGGSGDSDGGGDEGGDGGGDGVGGRDGDGDADGELLYVDLTYGAAVTDDPPEDGVSEVRHFPHGMAEFRAFVEEQGFWVEDPGLRARLEGRAIELVVTIRGERQRAWLEREKLQPIRRLRGLAEGSRCKLESFLDGPPDEEDGGGGGEDLAGHRFGSDVWPDCLAFIRDPSAPLAPLAQARQWTTYKPKARKRQLVSRLFDIKVNALVLGYPALRKAADAAMSELDEMTWS
jgi:hypothetical protein